MYTPLQQRFYGNSDSKIGHCVDLPIYNTEEKTFCGVTESWEPLISKGVEIIGYIGFPLLTLLIAAIVIVKLFRSQTFYKEDQGRAGLVAQVLWDAVDAAFDGSLYIYFARHGILDGKVSLDSAVKNCMLAFAFIGAAKILLWPLVLALVGEFSYDSSRNNHYTKMLMYFITFCLEDGPEVILEYFYFERYYTPDEHWYLLSKDFIVFVIALWTFFSEFKMIVTCELEGSWYVLSFCNVCISALLATRFIGAAYQYSNGILQRECFRVFDGALMQTPFASECLQASLFGYPIFVLFGISVLMMVIMAAVKCCD